MARTNMWRFTSYLCFLVSATWNGVALVFLIFLLCFLLFKITYDLNRILYLFYLTLFLLYRYYLKIKSKQNSGILGACLCQPPGMEYEPFMPLMLFVVEEHNELIVCVSAITEDGDDSIAITDVMTDALVEQGPYRSFDFEPPTLAMGTCASLLVRNLNLN